MFLKLYFLHILHLILYKTSVADVRKWIFSSHFWAKTLNDKAIWTLEYGDIGRNFPQSWLSCKTSENITSSHATLNLLSSYSKAHIRLIYSPAAASNTLTCNQGRVSVRLYSEIASTALWWRLSAGVTPVATRHSAVEAISLYRRTLSRPWLQINVLEAAAGL